MKEKSKLFCILCVSVLIINSCKNKDGVPHYDILAKNTSFEAVKIAVDSAKTGDIIIIPAGKSTWTSSLGYT
jgi:hypothetical protein